MKEYVYKVKNLECANCAAKIEEQVKKLNDVDNFSIDLMQYKVKLIINDKVNEKFMLKEVNRIADDIEPGAYFIANDDDFQIEAKNYDLLRIIASISFLLLAYISDNSTISNILSFAAYFIVGYDVIILAIKNFLKGRALDENFLMSIATVGAFFINERFEAVLVMLLYQIGEYLQNKAVDQSRKSIASLMDIKPEYAIKVVDNTEIKLDPEDIAKGDIIVVRPGERIPLDGIVIKGLSSVDTKALTGESLPREVFANSEVLSGSINIDGVIYIKVLRAYFESTVKQILDLVENASSNKAPAEKFIARFAKYYTPAVVIFALVLAFVVPIFTLNQVFSYSHFYNALTFLVISCPCALVISVPLSFFGGIGGASKFGVLFKGSNYVEALSKVDHVLFDKTGTLTEGNFGVVKIHSSYDHNQLLEFAAAAEYYSNHPIAKSIVKEYNQELDINLIKDVEEIAHHGVKVKYKDKEVLAGNLKLMKLNNISVSEIKTSQSIVYVAVDNEFYGAIVIADKIKDTAYEAVENLRKLNIKSIEMVTGDNKQIADDVSNQLRLDNAYSNLTPVDKVDILNKAMEADNHVVFVGDGINDAPVLTTANVGVAMGALGSDAAIEAADVVIMDDNPNKLSKAIIQSKRTMKIVKQNIFFALSIKFLFMILGTIGISNMAMAVFADVGVSLIAILNSVRLLSVSKI